MMEIVKGDITQQQVECIVNAANTTLLGGGGVDGAIHRAAGPQLLEFCKKLNGAQTGEAKITPGFRLHAKYVIHTPGPVWRGGVHNEPELLRLCYFNSMKLALKNEIRTIAFPSISTGVYGFPFDTATRIAMSTIDTFIRENPGAPDVFLVAFSDKDFSTMQKIFADMFSV
ncbi:MAG: O-acetyl-ADP-ribose deacetylase [Bacteroidetes bacterium GWF2_43_63]|nr:MAG: O-acetyl-ADP-ribose deacetylase [Bacteroidetes bacterium GWE2_42_42]OFY54392.1 MAG: O-acetyl-ADP-ribose deacetylase [Bacteroidetes bacterium GWF2_43_63]HBG69218.1 O-acetyl-ADP-ribose deacetylase [Bacteroidales bacterium]HCB61227.1 O-acetyl-ADP-ribose deacetylase [Bacteroidales bacterium]HCY24146.1 O-acetyl-ADP-ribose deacetylase [Bacteroidales bacterium]